MIGRRRISTTEHSGFPINCAGAGATTISVLAPTSLVPSMRPQYDGQSARPIHLQWTSDRPVRFTRLDRRHWIGFCRFSAGVAATDFTGLRRERTQFLSLQYNAFFQDDWRLRGGLTLNYGFVTNTPHRIRKRTITWSILTWHPDSMPWFRFNPGRPDLFPAYFPRTLVNPDRNNFAPRIGIAWRGPRNSWSRTGYGITYNAGAYSAMANQFVRQPPFAATAKNCVQYAPAISGAANTCLFPDAQFGFDHRKRFPPAVAVRWCRTRTAST